MDLINTALEATYDITQPKQIPLSVHKNRQESQQ